MIYDKPYIQLFVKPVYIDTSALTRRKTLVKTFFASLNSTKDAYFADNNDFNHNTASRPPLLVTTYISVHSRDLSDVRLSVIKDTESSVFILSF